MNMNGEEMQNVDKFKYLGVMINADGGIRGFWRKDRNGGQCQSYGKRT